MVFYGNAFECEIEGCNKKFKKKAYVRRHQLNIHPEAIGYIDWRHCSEENCGFKCKTKGQFTAHINAHKKPFVCNVCDHRYGNKYKLKDHMNCHTLEFTYKCKYPSCRGTYRTKGNLNSHMRRHIRMEYQCKWPHCGYESTNPIRYKTHLKTHETVE